MDALKHLHASTAGLLAQVDDSLARRGAPEEHPVWQLLRRTGALPGDVVSGLAGWSPEPWRQQAAALRGHAEVTVALGGDLDRLPSWEGTAGDAFAAARQRIGRDTRHRADRLRADAAFHEELADALATGRSRVARGLARVAASAEAVVLVTGVAVGAASATGRSVGAIGEPAFGPDPTLRAQAAATIAAALLTDVDALLRELDELLARGPAVVETKVVAADIPSTATTLRVEL
ncbi:hypothetical protein [Catellatospora citrea]|uniref:Uncharacterized protein n=1 Tax=Catellatospora citrea TaxID=53366 RepID=A0A8J3KPD5_9ACTN|nr:hypothetical protein [Catellatospora citrea]RKE09204.1 hypothetical protein C8E86_4085 [Catellatospora citrea]GIF99619.1 hypothetical protein Cci01nite_47130 [Catellatospora citrea]